MSIVDKYSDEIIQFILSGVGPKEICKLIKLCLTDTRQKLHIAGGMGKICSGY